ncbi:MAG: ABC transporter permease [Candidatus Bathyarchaeota archaeon]|nr:ABC transporter permease [Candidatus Bathyarchaeota archaeon]
MKGVKALNLERIQLFSVENLIWILIVIAYIMFSLLNPRFLEPTTIFSILQEAGMLGPLALGLGLCLIAGSFDVSLCRIAGLSLVITGWLCEFTDLPWFVIVPVPILLGLALGIFNGVLIGRLGLNSFLVTLAGYFMWDSLSRYIMMGRYFPPGRFDPHILFFGRGRIMDGPFVSTVIFIGLLLLIWFFMKYTKKGNAIYAVGASMDTARRLGINTKNIKLLVHAIAGALAGLCGLFFVGYAVEIKPVVVPPFYIFNAFVAIAIAGISISGGRGRIPNILGGAMLIAMTAYGATMMGVRFEFSYYVVPGTLFLVVIVLINRLDTFRDRILSRIHARYHAGSVSQTGRPGSKET